MSEDLELAACTPVPVDPHGFNSNAQIPYGLTTDQLHRAMESFLDVLGFVNQQLHTKGVPRLETLLMSANFSSIVGEFLTGTIPQFCPTLVKNRYHNGHPDLLPAGRYPDNMAQHVSEGIEVKASRYDRGWQGHNAEDIWLMVFIFKSNSATDPRRGVPPIPFRFAMVVGAPLAKQDWTFAGRSETSRRTIRASVNPSGYAQMMANWIYKEAALRQR